MRYLVLTDIHANLEALDACLADAQVARLRRRRSCSATSSATAPIPNAVVERVQALEPVAIVRGNHDKVACGLEQAEGFNAVAKSAARWTLDVADAGAPRLAGARCPKGPIEVDDLVEICHGSPFDEDAYIFDELDAVRALKAVDAAALPVRPHALSRHLRAVGAIVRQRRVQRRAADARAIARPAASTWSTPGRSASRATAIRAPPTPSSTPIARRVELFRLRVSGRRDAGEDHRGGAAGGAGAAAGGGAVEQGRKSGRLKVGSLPAFAFCLPALLRAPLSPRAACSSAA